MRNMIFVTGYFGAPIREEARRIASRKGWPVLDLDEEITKKDGRSIPRLCMMGGEHAYRNAEYEAVARLCGQDAGQGPGSEDGLVVACGDGILYDDDARELILGHELMIAGEDLPPEVLWENARQDRDTYHAFMKFGGEEEKKQKFEEHHRRQQLLFARIMTGEGEQKDD